MSRSVSRVEALRKYIWPDACIGKCVFKCVFKSPAGREALSHWLHLLNISPLRIVGLVVLVVIIVVAIIVPLLFLHL